MIYVIVGQVKSTKSAMGNNIEERLQKIEDRNKKVELDKSWETSWMRRILLSLFTYLAISIYLWAVGISNPWANAIVPAVAFMISTLTMPFFKRIWAKFKHEDKS